MHEDGDLHEPLLAWYADHQRDLPWRRPEASPWAVLVSEVMLQQTPVARVLPVYYAWMERWPTPSDLADEPAGEAVRAWGKLGYPRRALRLHAVAQWIRDRNDGIVPDDPDVLRGLPGIGAYTAAAVAAFAFRQRVPVLDTNVRRVFHRLLDGSELPPDVVRRYEWRDAARLLPEDPETAATWSVAVMELGALVCTAREARCDSCPVSDQCAWRAAGYPAYDGPPRRGQAWNGTDRQCRGRLLDVLRQSAHPVPKARLDQVWPDAEQRERCLASLLVDGLAVPVPDTHYALP